MAVSRAPAAPEITVRGTWCAGGIRLSHPKEEVRGFCVCERGGGGRSHQKGRDRKFPGTEHSAVCNIPASHSAIEGNLRLITGQVGQLEGGRTPV